MPLVLALPISGTSQEYIHTFTYTYIYTYISMMFVGEKK